MEQLHALANEGRARAFDALADAGDSSVVPWWVKTAGSADVGTRVDAARALVRLGDIRDAAVLLADPDARVRTSAACDLLTY
jgi:HEAT repeat protein